MVSKDSVGYEGPGGKEIYLGRSVRFYIILALIILGVLSVAFALYSVVVSPDGQPPSPKKGGLE